MTDFAFFSVLSLYWFFFSCLLAIHLRLFQINCAVVYHKSYTVMVDDRDVVPYSVHRSVAYPNNINFYLRTVKVF
jgi:hypothetical protein